MIAAFLLPFPFRGYRAPHLFVYYRFLSSLNEPALFILSQDYLCLPDVWRSQGRWEMNALNQDRLGYSIPSTQVMQNHQYRFLEDDLFQKLLGLSNDNPIETFRRLLLERIPQLEMRLSEILEEFDDRIEAVATWCNCPSLNQAAQSRGIAVINLELGPLRWPAYRPTAYLDFKGVNGNSEAEERYRASSFSFEGTVDQLRRFFVLEEDRFRCGSEGAIGVALQVEDDSNLIAYGHGFNNQSLITFVHLRYPDENVLVRPHPGSIFDLKDNWFKVDRSDNSIDFILRCSQILTVNSSVGLEALLHRIPVIALGDCSFSYVTRAESETELVSRLAYYLFAYLVPMDLIFDARYLRMRLMRPNDEVLIALHLKEYLGSGFADVIPDGHLPSELIGRATRPGGRSAR